MFFLQDTRPTGVCFLDFQAVRYASPVTDIMYFMYLCTSPNFRSEYFENINVKYYDTLKSSLKAYDIDINSVYPLEEFNKDIDEMLPYGLIIALTELKIVTLTPEDEAILKGANVEPDSDMTKVPGEDTLLKIRINEVIKESIDNGVMDKLLSKVQS